jgi:pimeloyl-ACP methyl ester carboxylesterase
MRVTGIMLKHLIVLIVSWNWIHGGSDLQGTFAGAARPAAILESLNLIRNDPMSAIDKITTQSLSYVTGSKSIRIPVYSNQSIHVLDFNGNGDLPPIVLLHGISSRASDYYPLIRCLQSQCSRVIAIDLPGHGETVANPNLSIRELEDLMLTSVSASLKALKIDRCILCGNSLGGFVAARYAARNSHKLHCLVLISPAGAPLSPNDLLKVKQLFKIETLGDAAKFLEQVFGRRRIPYLFDRVVGWACRERLRKPSVRRILEQATIHSSLREDELRSVRCPVLLIWGEREKVFEDTHLDWFVRNLPKKHLKVSRPEGVGHIPHLDPLKITGLIRDYLIEMKVPRTRTSTDNGVDSDED